jgi:hypothetical protein
MGWAGWLVLRAVLPITGLGGRLVGVLAPLVACLAVYAAIYAIVGGREVRSLWGRREDAP